MQKQCSKCKSIKDVSFFYKKLNGLQSCCKSCADIYNAIYKKNNREKIKINKHKRRALEKNASGKLSNGITNKLLTLQNNLCIVCRNKLIKYHIDHIVPLSKGGSNDDYNVQLLCPSCNHQKNAKHPIDFMQQKGYLL